MLAFQCMKRSRDEDDSDSEDERYMKKSRPWNIQAHQNGPAHFPSSFPPRPSLTPSPPRFMANFEGMTPAPSEASEANSPASVQNDQLIFSSPNHGMDVDMDVSMDDDDFDIIGSQPPDSPIVPFSLRPAKLNPQIIADSTSNTAVNMGRMPTPIFPSFHNQRGGPMSIAGMAGFNYPSSGMAGGMGMDNNYLGVPSMTTTTLLQAPTSRKSQKPQDQDRSRRMPSPISEDEDIPDTPTALTQSQLSRLSVTSHYSISESMDTEGAGARDDAPPGEVTTPSKGRKRSGAFTGKGRFSMGYREDCEKCKAKVPGHYSHFLS